MKMPLWQTRRGSGHTNRPDIVSNSLYQWSYYCGRPEEGQGIPTGLTFPIHHTSEGAIVTDQKRFRAYQQAWRFQFIVQGKVPLWQTRSGSGHTNRPDIVSNSLLQLSYHCQWSCQRSHLHLWDRLCLWASWKIY